MKESGSVTYPLPIDRRAAESTYNVLSGERPFKLKNVGPFRVQGDTFYKILESNTQNGAVFIQYMGDHFALYCFHHGDKTFDKIFSSTYFSNDTEFNINSYGDVSIKVKISGTFDVSIRVLQS